MTADRYGLGDQLEPDLSIIIEKGHLGLARVAKDLLVVSRRGVLSSWHGVALEEDCLALDEAQRCDMRVVQLLLKFADPRLDAHRHLFQTFGQRPCLRMPTLHRLREGGDVAAE